MRKHDGVVLAARQIWMTFVAAVLVVAQVGCGKDGAAGGSEPQQILTAISVNVPATVIVGQTALAYAAGSDQYGGAMSLSSIVWSSSAPNVVTVSTSGSVTGIGGGIATLTATADGKTGRASITVIPVAVASIVVSPSQLAIVAGTAQQLTATVKDASGTELTGRPILWASSDVSKASVSQDGVVTGVTPSNSVIVSATSEGHAATVTVIVTPSPIQSVTVMPATAFVPVRGTAQLTVNLRDATGTLANDRVVHWSSRNPSILSVSATGLVTALVVGGAVTVTAESEGKIGSAQISVIPSITALNLTPVSAGDTLTVRGHGLLGALMSLNEVALPLLRTDDSTLSVRVPSSLPTCTNPLTLLRVRISVGAFFRDTVVPTFGGALNAPTIRGQHVISPEVGTSGCRMKLMEGTYGVALYTLADTTPLSTESRDTVLRPVTLRINRSGTTSILNSLVRMRDRKDFAVSIRNWDVLKPRQSTLLNAPCTPPRRLLGDTVSLVNVPYHANEPLTSQDVYRVYAVTTHYVFMARPALFDTIPAGRKLRLDTIASLAEKTVYPFLDSTLGPQPDVDSDGHLNVLLENDNGHYGGPQYANSSCPYGDFVDIGWSGFVGNDVTFDGFTEFENLSTLTHESAHWYDHNIFGPWYAVEGFAMVMQSVWASERMRKYFWTAHWGESVPSDLPTHWTPQDLENSCAPPAGHLTNGYGELGGYRTGCTILEYLIDQRRREGANPATLLRALSKRPDGLNEIGKLWRYLGGGVRSASTLQGELMLSLYADGLISGISDHLQSAAIDMNYFRTCCGEQFQFPLTTIAASNSLDLEVPLRLPDGVVIEIVVPPGGAIISLPISRPNVGFGIVVR